MVAPATVASRLDGLETPVALVEWWPAHLPSDNLLWSDGLSRQCDFVQHTLGNLLMKDVTDNETSLYTFKSSVRVVSTHTSKSVRLPVFQLVHPTKGLELVMRYNFNDWKVSVLSDRAITDTFFDLFDKSRPVNEGCCEGFAASWVFGPYAEDRQKFTVELDNDSMFTFVWLLIKGYEMS